MRKGLMLAAASLFVLSACSQEHAPASGSSAAEATTVDIAAPAAEAADTQAPTIAAPPAPIAQIAYAYSYALSLPRDRGAEMMSRHELACASAGPGYCQVISAHADWTGREPGGHLELRGQPEWINRFRAGLALEAQNAGGRLDEAATEGEDVTRGIDTAQTVSATSATLTERLRALQGQRGGTVAQRLEVEREIGRLQAEHDAQQIALRELNDRVQSARLTLDYRQGGVMAADNPVQPVARALADSLGLSMTMLGILITLGSVVLPVAAIAGLTWWAIRRRRKPLPA